MSLISDFELAWKSFEDKITADIARDAMKHTITDVDSLQASYQRLIRLWEDPSKVQSGFLRKWSASAPTLERGILGILRNFRFHEVKDVQRPTSVPYLLGAVILAVAGGIIGYALPGNMFPKALLGQIPVIVLAIVIFSVVGGGILKSLYEVALDRACKRVVNQYIAQVEQLHKSLRNFCDRIS